MQSKETDGLTFNCEHCMAKELMGKVHGRVCLINQVDFEELFLYYQTIKIETEEDFHIAVDEVLDQYKVDRIEVALKRFGLYGSRIHGICIKSYPMSLTTLHLLSILNICLGGETGSELTNLPMTGGILDQPNLFIQAYGAYVAEHARYMQEVRAEEKNANNR